MAILSFSPAASKGASSVVTLNKSELYALAPISGDAFWSTSANVKRVIAVYESTTGEQTKVLRFDTSESSPAAAISFTSAARDEFHLKYIVLKDGDGGKIRLDRPTLANLGVSLDLSLSGGGQGGGQGGGGGGQNAATISLYHFDGDANDVNGRHLVATGSPSYTTGRFGQAVTGFSSSNYLSNNSNPSPINVGNSQFTIEFWAKLNSNNTDQTILRYGYNDGTEGEILFILAGNGNIARAYKQEQNGSVNMNWAGISPNGIVNDGNYHHFVIQRVIGQNDNGQALATRVYIDGEIRDGSAIYNIVSGYVQARTIPNDATLSIGYSSGDSQGAFMGAIDELRISNVALYDLEFTGSFTPPSSPLT